MSRTLLFGSALVVATFPIAVQAQTHELTGRVREAATGLPIANAEVRIRGHVGVVCTNVRGEYRLSAGVGEVPLVIARAAGFNAGVIRLGPADTTADFAIAPEGVEPSPAENGPVYAASGWIFNDKNVVLIELGEPIRCTARTPSPRGTGASWM